MRTPAWCIVCSLCCVPVLHAQQCVDAEPPVYPLSPDVRIHTLHVLAATRNCTDCIVAVLPLCHFCPCTPHANGYQQEHPGSNFNRFDAKTDKSSADLYFHYYGMLQHQQNMLQVRWVEELPLPCSAQIVRPMLPPLY